jgi:hypothetical protein
VTTPLFAAEIIVIQEDNSASELTYHMSSTTIPRYREIFGGSKQRRVDSVLFGVFHGMSDRSLLSTFGEFKRIGTTAVATVFVLSLTINFQLVFVFVLCVVFSQSLRHGGVTLGGKGSHFIEFIEQFSDVSPSSSSSCGTAPS